MPKTKEPKLTAKQLTKIQTDMADVLRNDIYANGLQGVIFGSNGSPGSGFPSGPGNQNVSQVNEIFGQLRWYFVSNFRQVVSEVYAELALIRTIVDVPVDDGLRGGVEFSSKQLSPQDLDLLKDTMEREEDIHHFTKGLYWTRLFGGGGVIAITNQDPSQPMRPLMIGEPLAFKAFDLWELFFSLQNTYGAKAPGYSALPMADKVQHFDYYGQNLHTSRVFRQTFTEAPSFLQPRLRGWGFSVLETLVRSLNQYLEGTSLIYELVDEAKIDVFGIKNLTNTLMAPNGALAVRQRIQMANQAKNFQHALVMDADDKYEQKTLTFSGLADVMEQIRTQVASDLRIPKTKLFGESANGFNSGESDLEVYNGMIESTVRTPAKKYLLRMAQLRCQTLFGYSPDDLKIEFQPLRVLGAEAEAKVKDSEHTRLLSSAQAGFITLEEYREACNRNDLLGIQLSNENLPEGSDELGSLTEQGEEAEGEKLSDEETKENPPFGGDPSAQE